MKTIKLLQLKIEGQTRIVIRNASARKLFAMDIDGASLTIATAPAIEIKSKTKAVKTATARRHQ